MSLIAQAILLPVIVLASIAIISSIYYFRQQNFNFNERIYQLTATTTTERYKLITTTQSIANNFLPAIQCNCQILPNCPYYANSGRTWDPNQIQRCGFDPSTFSIQICCPVDTSKPQFISIPKPEKEHTSQTQKPVQFTVYPSSSTPSYTHKPIQFTTVYPPSSIPSYNVNETVEEDYPILNVDIRTGKPKKPISNYLDELKENVETEKPESDTLLTVDEQMNESELIFMVRQLFINSNLSQHENFKLLPQSTEECGSAKSLPLLDIKRKRRRKRVVGGMKASIEKYPWMVRLYYNNTYRCETEMCFGCLGTVLNHKYILTNAHCALLPSNPMIIVAGDGRNTKNYSVEKTIPHQDYDNLTKHHDIALIRIRESINFGEFLRPVCLPFFEAYHITSEDELTNSQNNEVLVAGWGVSNSSDTSTIGKELRDAVVPEWPIAACQKVYEQHNRNKTITVQQFCTGADKKTKSDACWGDSGGGIYTLKSMIQVGIVSYGFPSPYECGSFPGVNTRLIFYLKWILDSISP